MDKFFCCHVEGTGGFTYRHSSWELAHKEAARLAQLNLGKKVYVLEVKEYCEIEPCPITWYAF